MSLKFGAQRLGVLQSPVQGGDLFTGLGDFVLELAETLSLGDLTGCRLGEPDAGQIRFGTRLVERAAQLLQPALEQNGPVRAREGPRARSRYAFSQGEKTMRNYSKTPDFAKPVRSRPVP